MDSICFAVDIACIVVNKITCSVDKEYPFIENLFVAKSYSLIGEFIVHTLSNSLK